MLKSKSALVVVGLMLAGAVSAQAAQSPIKKVKQQVSISEDVKVGTTVLKSGKYEVASNDKGQLTFRRMVQDVAYPMQWNYDMKEQPVVVKASATVLDKKNRGTELDIADNGGVRVLKSITLDDTNVKFTIEQ